ncbi:4061_t:CDS:2, partial [Entrophospora sp. SA101]
SLVTEKTADDFVASATPECLPFETVYVHGIITLLGVLVNELLAHRAEIDGNDKLLKFSTDLEQACIDSVDIHCKMTKDLALSIHRKNLKREHHVNTDEFWLLL